MSKAGRVIACIIGALCLAAVIAVIVMSWVLHDIKRDLKELLIPYTTDASDTKLDPAELPRLMFLSNIDFDAGPVRLVLEPVVTGTDALLIEDQALLRQAAMTASIPDHGVGGRGSLIEMVFNGDQMRQREVAARVYQNGYGYSTDYCLPDLCSDAETQQSLAPLIAAASAQVVTHHDTFTDYDAYKAAFQRARAAPNRLTELSNSPSPRGDHPISYILSLPALVRPDTDDPAPASSLAELDDAISALLAEAQGNEGMIFLDARQQAPDVPFFDSCAAVGAPLERLEDATLTLLEMRGYTDEEGYDRLAAIADWSFLPLPPAPVLPEGIAARLASGDLSPECLTIWTAEGPRPFAPVTLSPPTPKEYSLEWKEALPLER